MDREGYLKHKALIEAWANGAEVEYYSEIEHRWVHPSPNPNFYSMTEYRIKQIPDSIDRSHVKDNMKWMARDENGNVSLFEDKPSIGEDDTYWRGQNAHFEVGIENLFASYKQGTVDWKDSLVQLTYDVNT